MSRAADVKSANNYSMVGRVYSWKVARTVFTEHPWVGVGPANMETELAAVYRREFPVIESAAYLKPHNQLLYWLVSFGLLGTLLAVAAFYYPLLGQWRRPPPLLLAQYIILSLSFLVEPTLETPVGLPFAVLFVLLAGQRIITTHDKPSSYVNN
jgi:O-antigen ligase